MSKKIVAIVTAILLVLGGLIPNISIMANADDAGTIYLDGTVAENGDGTKDKPYNNFNDAINAVSEGGIIQLTGDYEKEFSSYDDFKLKRVRITKDITLDLNQHKINIINMGKTSTGDGLSIAAGVNATLKNGLISSNKPAKTSGTVCVEGNAEAILIDCTVKAAEGKPGVYLKTNSSFYAERTIFDGKDAGLNGISGEAKKIHMVDCTVEAPKNTVSVTSSNMKFENCTVGAEEGQDAYFVTVENSSTAIISGGEIKGNVNIGWKSNGTLQIEGDTAVTGQLKLGQNNENSYMNIAGGKYAFEEELINSTRHSQITVSGGYFKNENVIKDFVKAPYKIIANTDADSDIYPYTIQNIPEGTVACVGNKTFSSIEDAIATANGKETILLIADVETDTLAGKINGSGKTITYKGTLKSLLESDVTLANANLKCNDADISNIAVSDGKLTGGIVNSGDVSKILEEDYFVSYDTGKIADVSAFEATIGKTGYEALISATTIAARTEEKETIVLQKDKNNGHEELFANANYILDLNGHTMGDFIVVPNKNLVPNNVDITITDTSAEKSGKIISEDNFAIATNGVLENVKLTLDGITVESKVAAGIYFPSSGKLTVKNSRVIGVTGIEIRGGELEVENSEISATATGFSENANGNGSTITGAAIAVSQHTTNHNIKVEIKSGTFKGIKALYETDLQDDKNDNIDMSVVGGNFDGQVESDNVAGFITGGTFSEWLGKELIADKSLAIQKGDSFYVGLDAEAVIASAKPGDKIIVLLAVEKLNVPEGVIVQNNTGEEIIVNDTPVKDGESIEIESIVKPEEPSNPSEKPDDEEITKPVPPNEDVNDDEDSDSDKDKDKEKEELDSVKTGDDIAVGLLAGMLLLSGAGFVALRRKEK